MAGRVASTSRTRTLRGVLQPLRRTAAQIEAMPRGFRCRAACLGGGLGGDLRRQLRAGVSTEKGGSLLRAWLHRLRETGVSMHVRHRWLGFGERPCSLRFATPAGEIDREFDAVVLAMGGGSRRARLGRCLVAAAGRQGVAVAAAAGQLRLRLALSARTSGSAPVCRSSRWCCR